MSIYEQTLLRGVITPCCYDGDDKQAPQLHAIKAALSDYL